MQKYSYIVPYIYFYIYLDLSKTLANLKNILYDSMGGNLNCFTLFISPMSFVRHCPKSFWKSITSELCIDNIYECIRRCL